MKPVIQEVIVVEGAHDSALLKKFYECDTIITGGTGITEETMDLIAQAQKTRGVIVFTDPDSPGNRIRNWINQAVPECKNAFVMKKDAHTTKKVGVEHASFEVIEEALKHVVTIRQNPKEEITAQDFYELGLSGQADSKERREKLGAALHIGMGSAKTMRLRLNCLGMTKEEVREKLNGETDRQHPENP